MTVSLKFGHWRIMIVKNRETKQTSRRSLHLTNEITFIDRCKKKGKTSINSYFINCNKEVRGRKTKFAEVI